MKLNKILLYVFLVFLFFQINYSQKLITHFENISLDEGLSQTTVNSIIQDKEGFIWIATQDGLNKYDGYKFTIYRYDENNTNCLSYNYLYTIYEDSDGYLWIGTDKGGLNRFDKKKEKFIHFKRNKNSKHSIISNVVRTICEDRNGNLWIGTYEGLSFLPAKYRSSPFNSIDKIDAKFKNFTTNTHNLSNNTIGSIICDSNGNLWIGTANGLNLLENKNINNPTFINFQNDKQNPRSISNNIIPLGAIHEDKSGNIWIGTQAGLNKFISKENGFSRIKNNNQDGFNLQEHSVNAILEDSQNILWIGTNKGLIKFNPRKNFFRKIVKNSDEAYRLSSNNISTIIEDKGGNIWIGTRGGGLNKINYGSDKFKHYKIKSKNLRSTPNNNIWSIYKDKGNNLWIGTDDEGVFKFNSNLAQNYKQNTDPKFSITDNKVTSIYEDSQKNIWIGTNNGLNKLDYNNSLSIPKISQFYASKNSHSLSSNKIRSIQEDKNNNLWIGTWGGGLSKIPAESISKNKVSFYTIQNKSQKKNYLSCNFMRPVHELSDGYLWIGTYIGLNILLDKNQPEPKQFLHIFKNPNNPKSLTNDGFSSILEDSNKNIWIGTRNGINKLDYIERKNIGTKEINFKHYRESDGLNNEVIYGMLEDYNQNIWCSTNKGLSKINSTTGKITNYCVEDGLQSDEFNAGAFFKDENGQMYFGGINGYTQFHPDSITTYNYLPPVYITDFLILNKSITVEDSTIISENINFTDEITLDYKNNMFAFEFSALAYRQPKNNKYAYKLEGFQDDWIETDYLNRRATYTRLPHGEYIFKVKACNDDGVWNEKETSIKVTILPPVWKSWWANILYLFTLLFCLYLLFLSQKKKVTQKQRELEIEKRFSEKLELYNKTLEDKVHERTKELRTATDKAEEANKLKTELLSIAAHDLKNPLNIILGFSSLIKNDIPENSESKEYLESIRKSSDDMLEIISKLLDSAAIETGKLKLELESVDIIQIVNSVINEYQSLALNKNQSFDSEMPNKFIFIKADTGRIKEVISNIVSNAIKYSPFNSQIDIRIKEKSKKVLIEIKDHGQGISSNDQKNLFKKFQKLSSIPTGGESSTGLGLSIAKKLTELHNGSIEVISELELGSTFRITLPIEKIVDSVSDSELQIKNTQVNFFNQKIIIADDLRENRKLIIQLLKKYNLTLIEVNDGNELIEMSQKIRPDFIFCDINMPGMNGIEALKIIRSSEDLKTIPVIAVTSLRENEIKNADFNALIIKPITRLKLVEELKTHLQFSSDLTEKNASVITEFKKIDELKKEIKKIKKTEILILEKKHKRANATMIIDDVLSLATFIEYVSDKYNLNELKLFSNRLQEYCKHFDVQKINNSLFVLSEIST